MRKIKSISGLVESIVDDRMKTQSVRFKALDENVEKVKDVLDGAMQIIAERFAPDGFKYAKSKRTIYRAVGGFRHEVQMESDSSNLSGVHVGTYLTVTVKSNKFKKWEEDIYKQQSTGFISGSQIGYMTPEHSYLKWELVDVESRVSEIESMISYIKKYAIDYFDNFLSVEHFHSYIKKMDFSILSKNYAVNYAVWLGDKDLAEKIILSILKKHSSSENELREYITKYRDSGYPDMLYSGDHAKCWAKGSIILGLFNE